MTLPGLASPATGQDIRTDAPDPIAALAAELKAGGRPLTFSGPDKGYAPSLLQRLNVAEDSQVLVFSKTSLQVEFVRPTTPRAIYFNDSLAIGTIPGAPLIEMWAVGNDGLLRFYSLKNTRAGPAQVQAEENLCVGCHKSINPALPGPMLESVTTLPSGLFLHVDTNGFTDGRTPIAERWGGWYVTGRHGTMAHRGNVVAPSLADPALPPQAGQNVTGLTGRFELTRYTRPTSDIVALMTLDHQVGFMNLASKVQALAAAHADLDAMTAGVNDLVSAERNRKFTVVLPADTTAQNLPVVFLFHGVNDDMGGILNETHYADNQKTEPFILVVPQSERDATGKAVSQTDWAYGLHAFGDDNQDLVFFDDMLKCVSQQYKTDAKRVYVTGFSGGGLMTVFTSFAREKVIAASAPSSGGYLFKFPSTTNKFPDLVTWGGGGDSAYGQNFDLFAKDLIPFLVSDKHYVIQCNHDTGHKWPAAMTAANWAFLSRFKLGEAPQPFVGDTLPAVFPKYCTLAK